MTTLYKLADELDEGLERAKQWRNLYFLKDGSTFHGIYIATTENEAIEIGKDLENSIEEALRLGYLIIKNIFDGRTCYIDTLKYSHFIPMPVKE